MLLFLQVSVEMGIYSDYTVQDLLDDRLFIRLEGALNVFEFGIRLGIYLGLRL